MRLELSLLLGHSLAVARSQADRYGARNSGSDREFGSFSLGMSCSSQESGLIPRMDIDSRIVPGNHYCGLNSSICTVRPADCVVITTDNPLSEFGPHPLSRCLYGAVDRCVVRGCYPIIDHHGDV